MAAVLACVMHALVACVPALALAASQAPPPTYTVASWTMDDGLPHNLIHAVAQGADGQLWVGTWEGVARFDGRDFTVFDRQNTPGAELSGVFAIARDHEGGMLFGTAADGVFRHHQGQWRHLGDAAAQRLQVSALLADRDGSVWVGTRDALYRIAPDGHLSAAGRDAGLPAAAVTALLPAPQGGVLVGTGRGLYRLSGQGAAEPWGRDHGMGEAMVRQLAQDRDGGLLVAGDDGVWHRHADGRMEHLHPGERVISVLQDRHGQLWMALMSGRLLRQLGNGNSQTIAVEGVVSPALLEDAEGLLWVGSSHGLSRVAEGAAHGITTADGLRSDYTRAVLETGDGSIWIGHAAGLDRMRDYRLEPVPLTAGADPSVLALALASDGGVWVGTYDQGVMRLDAGGKVLQRIGSGQELPSSFVRALLQDPDGGVWIGTTAGLVHYRDGQIRRPALDDEGVAGGSIQVLYRDGQQTLWIGSDRGMAAIRADGRTQQWKGGENFPAQNAFDFLRDADGGLWVASDRGLLRLRRGRFTVYDHRVGLPRDKLFRIIDDGHGYFWLSSNRGVFRVARRDFDEIDESRRLHLAVEVVDRSDGMPGNQGNGGSAPAGWMTRSGTLLFPTSAGLGMIRPAQVGTRQPRPVPVVFDRVMADGLVQPAGGHYRLAAGTQRLAITYAGLNFQAPDKVRYRYRMLGFDPDWVDAGDGAQAVYTNLRPGDYRFEVQATTLPVDWNRSQAVGTSALTLQLVPPWWRHPAVPAILLLLVVGTLLALYGWRIASFRRRQRHMAAVIAARTRELSDKNVALLAADREREELVRRLEYQASHDVLTGLPNRREAEHYLRQAVAKALQAGTPLVVALLDIDHFKRINDGHGHEVGDEVLRRVGDVLAGAGLEGVFAARHGGEEFLLVMPGLDLRQAESALQALLADLRAIRVPVGADTVSCTASIGVVVLTPNRASARELLIEADRQLYTAKRGGRDRLSIA